MQRKFTVIFAAAVVGYSRFMERDEAAPPGGAALSRQVRDQALGKRPFEFHDLGATGG